MRKAQSDGKRVASHAREPLGGCREVFSLAYPVTLSMLFQTTLWLTDTAFLGRVGTVEQGAAGFAGTCVWLMLSFCLGISIGVNIIVSQAFGSQHLTRCGLIAWQGLYVSVLLWLPILVGGLYARQVVQFFGPSPDLIHPAATYMQIRLLGALPTLANFTLLGFFRGLGDTRTPLWVTVLISGLNVILDYLLIFGRAGFPRLEIAGAAMATVISTAVGSLLYIWLFLSRSRRQGLLARRWQPFDWEESWSLVRVSLPVGLQSVLEGSAWTLFTALVAHLGAVEAAAHQIALNLLSLAYMLGYGVTIAATTLVGQYLGAGNLPAARRSARSCLAMGVLMLGPLGTGFFLGRHMLVWIFNHDPDVISLGAYLVLFVSPFQLFQGLSLVAIGILRGAGDTRWPMLASLIIGWGLFLPGATLAMFAFQGGVSGGWLAATFYGLILSLAMLTRVRQRGWQHHTLA
jgi:multidrug resistance protein, MATE family